jgi:hypothetical protein
MYLQLGNRQPHCSRWQAPVAWDLMANALCQPRGVLLRSSEPRAVGPNGPLARDFNGMRVCKIPTKGADFRGKVGLRLSVEGGTKTTSDSECCNCVE